MRSNSSSVSVQPQSAAHKRGYWFAIGILAFVVLLSGQPAFGQGVDVTMPVPTGSYAVGRTIFEWTDSARAERYSDDPDAKRELSVWVWYPAESTPEVQSASYLPGMLGQLVGQQYGLNAEQIHTGAYSDAPLAASASAYPVLVFSPGNSSLIATYSALLEEIASHGYVVAGINHTYNAPVTVFGDGRIIPASQESVENESFAYWVEDTAFVVDQLAAINSGDDRFGEKLDLARLGLFGHSIGGATAADFCLVDARCQAGINLDGTLWGEAASQGVTQPFMQIFSITPTCEEVVEAGGAPSLEQCQALAETMQAGWQEVFETARAGYNVTITGTTHNSFTDNHFLLPLLPALEDGATIDAERAWRITADYALAFFDKYLNGKDAPLLDASSPAYPEVTFERHEN